MELSNITNFQNNNITIVCHGFHFFVQILVVAFINTKKNINNKWKNFSIFLHLIQGLVVNMLLIQ